ncbi:extracellular solute-binding protein family 5 [Beutenbergia cavernae DSM 12333]|uniref:Extracellular solute-binding protein family 5 n=1 Tax=Beutenbergia cavernae (strain ATCC BAA-8 / DSM 12333 / CCUG 43141 / JCM 11478 / NBRC 16432 / NCIMB 13614 / HKI 0122) TaxID=471853 RepID=C5C2H0_BEUC1|nr:ABC transporter substrate-binding protein [Beutenbergia cavernae]ACQ79656.1 extracellular solute-binding protein family 5 [Beutenbergia cavernae DSM 12333]
MTRHLDPRTSRRRPRLAALGATAAALALVLTACSSGGGASDDGDDGAAGGEQEVLTVHANTAPTYQENFNPLSPSVLPGTRGLVYEPLIAYTPMKPGEGEPWLAESMEFNEDGTQVTFTLREGVQWNDEEPFTADDVVFTFLLYRDNPATNTGALPVTDAEATDERTAVITFGETMYSRAPQLGNTITLPEHVFAEQDPVEFLNADPVGTGPYVVDRFTDQVYDFAQNPNYWDADNYEVETISFPASSADTFNVALSRNELQWSGGFVANIDDIYVSKDAEHNKYWYPGDGIVGLFVNQQRAPMNDVAFRQALSLAVDRDQLSSTAMQSYTPPAHPTGLPLPAFDAMMDPDLADAEYVRDVDEANSILDDAGYAMGADGVRTAPDGTPLSFDLIIPSDWTDWVTIAGLLQEQLAEIGVQLAPQGVAFQSWVDQRNGGNYDLTLGSVAAGTAPYFMYRSMMSSEFEVAEGEAAVNNFARWYDAESDAFFDAYESTNDPEVQLEAIQGLENIVVEELPIIPLLQSPNWFQYRTEFFTGWPSEEDPYALGAPYMFPDNLLVVRALEPAGE